jgi:hypothetical protein
MDLAPPAIYDHAYKGHLTEKRGSLAEVKFFCHTRIGVVSAYEALGCAEVYPGRCIIMIPKVGGKITAKFQAQIRRHEIAHCNGWTDHRRR